MSLRIISVVVTAFQTPQWIGKCLNSILRNPLPPNYKLQLIVGVDGCPETAAATARRYTSVAEIYMMKKNYGTYITFNTMMQMAKGDIICRFDSDDEMFPGFLKSGIEIINSGKDIVRFRFKSEKLAMMNERDKTSHGVLMFTRKLWDTLGGYQPWRCGADSDFVERAESARFRSFVPKNPLFFYRSHPQSLCSDKKTNFNSVYRPKRREVRERSARFYKRTGNRVIRIIPLVGQFYLRRI